MTTTQDHESLYNKVRGLLRKAEGTDNEHEAAAFYNKAQELIMRYAIDEEKMWASDPAKRSKIETVDISIADRGTGANEKRMILHACAKTNRCRMWYSPGKSRSTIAGYSSDVLFVEMLYSSIITQMNFKMAIGQAVNVDIHHKTFRNSFMAGFASRIWDRFAEMSKKRMEDVASEGTGMELVLLDRAAKVDKWVEENFRIGRARAATKKRINYAAYGQGTTAANETDISGGRNRVARTQRKELNQ